MHFGWPTGHRFAAPCPLPLAGNAAQCTPVSAVKTACGGPAAWRASHAPLRQEEEMKIQMLEAELKQQQKHLGCWFFYFDITFLTCDDLFMKLVTAIVELVGLPVSQKHFTAAHLRTQKGLWSNINLKAWSCTTMTSTISGSSQQNLWGCLLLEISQACDCYLRDGRIELYNNRWVWCVWVCMLTLHSLPELRVHLEGYRDHSRPGAQNSGGALCQDTIHSNTCYL